VLFRSSRASNWGIPFDTFLGDIANLHRKVDVVIMSSLLHHIPVISEFLEHLEDKLNPNGILLHIHDPNGDYLSDSLYLNRKSAYAKNNRPSLTEQIFHNSKWVKALKSIINRLRGLRTHIEIVNEHLLLAGVIKRRLKAEEIWSITDIHVEDLPYSTQKGICLSELKLILNRFQLLHALSYGFFGKLLSEMPAEYQRKETELIEKGEMNGRYLGAVWKKN